MPKIEVFELAGPAVPDPERDGAFAREQCEAGLKWLRSRGVEIQWHAVGPDGLAPGGNPTVTTAIELQGRQALPIILLDGTIMSIGGYPTRSDF